MQEEASAVDFSPGSLDLLAGSVGNDDDRAILDEEQLQAEEDAQFEAASAATMGPIEDLSAKQLFEREQQLLQEMTDIAEPPARPNPVPADSQEYPPALGEWHNSRPHEQA